MRHLCCLAHRLTVAAVVCHLRYRSELGTSGVVRAGRVFWVGTPAVADFLRGIMSTRVAAVVAVALPATSMHEGTGS